MRKDRKIIGIICILLMIGIVFGILYYRDKKENDFKKKEGDIFVQEESDLEKEIEKIPLKNKDIRVHIDGEINKPGVYTLEEESILDDLVKLAGGLTKEADAASINLAELLQDNGKVVIPKILTEEEKEQLSKNALVENNSHNNLNNESIKINKQTSSDKNGKVNINTASLSELDEIPGIGPATANKIISYREENGGFKSLEDLKNVDRIGDKTFEKLKEFICI